MTAVIMFCLFLCVVVTEDCNRPNIEEILQKSDCQGYEIAVHSVWTEIQCLDNCLRHPYCDKYIFDRQEDQTCTLLYTGDIVSVLRALSLPWLDGRCTSKIATVSMLEILGSEFMTVKLGQKTLKSKDIFDTAAWLAHLAERQSAWGFEPQTGPTLRVLK